MPSSRSKSGANTASERRSRMRSILLGLLIGFAVVFAALAGRYAYGKSKDPDYRLADLFGIGSSAEGTASERLTLPVIDIDALTRPSEEGTAGSEPEMEATSETALPPASSEEETAGTETSPGETAEETAETTPEETAPETTETASAEIPPETLTEDAGETAEETETPDVPEMTGKPAVISDPSDIRYHLARCGMEDSSLGSCGQLIAVQSDGTNCTLYFFEKTDGNWAASGTVGTAPGIVGRNGVTAHKVALDGCTPAGYFGLGPCYGAFANVQTKMEYRQITEHDYWVGFNETGYYNELIYIEDTKNVPWTSYEHLIDIMPHYRYLAVIRYNMDPVVPYAGAAIFLHCDAGDKTTSGCVGTGEDVMREIFSWLDPAADPHILIY